MQLIFFFAATQFSSTAFSQVNEVPESQSIIEKVSSVERISTLPSSNWRFSNGRHSTYQTLGSIEAQHGNHLLEIDTSAITFPIDYREYYPGYRQPTTPQGFLYQTISATQLVGKHVHISVFAKSSIPNFTEIEKRFEQYFLEEQETGFAEDFELTLRSALSQGDELTEDLGDLLTSARDLEFAAFAKYLQQSYAFADFGVSVLLHFGIDKNNIPIIVEHSPTSSATPRQDERWNRFNIEIGIPEQCEAVSIVFWSRGVNIVQYDHVAIVPHGDALDKRVPRYGLGLDHELVKAVLPIPPELDAQFQNLSFEE